MSFSVFKENVMSFSAFNENIMGFSLSRKDRKYLSDNDLPIENNEEIYIISDHLHKDRKHQDHKIGLWFAFNSGINKSKVLLSYRKRNTSSPYKWVEQLKKSNLSTSSSTVFVYTEKIKKSRLFD